MAIKRLLGCLWLLLCCVQAQAAIQWSGNGAQFPTKEAACQSWQFANVTRGVYGPWDSKGTMWYCADIWADGSKHIHMSTGMSGTCDTGTTFNPTTGTCDGPSNPCASNDTKNSYVRKFVYSAGGSGLPKDDGQCKITNPKLLRCYVDAVGVKYCFFEFYKTTEKADPSSPDQTTPGTSDNPPIQPDNPTDKTTTSPPVEPDTTTGQCPEGTVQIGSRANGDPICVGTGKYPDTTPPVPPMTTKPPVTTTNDDGSTKTTQDVVQTNSDGSTTTTTTTTTVAADGSKTVTVSSQTSAGAGGQPGKQDTPDLDKYDLCKQNPMLAVCRNSSVSGSCGQIVCEGDAIQCATLRAAAAMQCAQQADVDALNGSAQKTLGDQILSGSDPMAKDISDAIKGTEVDLSKPTLDQGGFVAGSCLANRTLSVLGQSVSVDFSTLCNNIQPLRGVVMACAFILAYLIVARSVLQS